MCGKKETNLAAIRMEDSVVSMLFCQTDPLIKSIVDGEIH